MMAPPRQCAVPGNVEENFRQHTHRGATGELREFLREFVGCWNERGYFLPPAHQELAEWPEQVPLPTHIDVALLRLHAEQDHTLSRPVKWQE